LRDETDIEQLGPELPRGLAFLRHLVETVRRNTEREDTVRLYAVLSAESVTEGHPAQDYFRERYAGLRAFVTEALAEASEPGETRAGLNLEDAANAIIADMDGVQIQWLLAPDSVDMAASTDRVITALLTKLTTSRTCSASSGRAPRPCGTQRRTEGSIAASRRSCGTSPQRLIAAKGTDQR
jgi:hypothetical protein